MRLVATLALADLATVLVLLGVVSLLFFLNRFVPTWEDPFIYRLRGTERVRGPEFSVQAIAAIFVGGALFLFLPLALASGAEDLLFDQDPMADWYSAHKVAYWVNMAGLLAAGLAIERVARTLADRGPGVRPLVGAGQPGARLARLVGASGPAPDWEQFFVFAGVLATPWLCLVAPFGSVARVDPLLDGLCGPVFLAFGMLLAYRWIAGRFLPAVAAATLATALLLLLEVYTGWSELDVADLAVSNATWCLLWSTVLWLLGLALDRIRNLWVAGLIAGATAQIGLSAALLPLSPPEGGLAGALLTWAVTILPSSLVLATALWLGLRRDAAERP